MNYTRIALYLVVALLVVLLAGFFWGRSGRSALEARLGDAEVSLDLWQARAHLLAARVDIFEVNFGRAGQHLQAARQVLQEAADHAAKAGREDEAGAIKDVAGRVVQAQDQAARLDQSANTTLAGAAARLEQIAANRPRQASDLP